jgi:hypothetical protein
MPAEKAALAEFKIGTFVCPETKASAPLMATSPLPYLHWPFVVQKCPQCGGKHALECEDVEHPPAFGYE